MSADWNPNAPGTVGLEWFPDQVVDVGVSAVRCVALTVDSTAAETIAAAFIGVGSVSVGGSMLVEVFPEADVVAGAETTSSFAPNGTLTGAGGDWADDGGSTTGANLAAAINNGVVNTAVYDEYNGTYTARTRFELNFPTAGALWPANQRVINGNVVFAAALQDGTGQVQVWYNQAGTRVLMGTCTLTTDVQTFSVPLGEINPVTSLPWTRAEVQDFDTASGFGFRPLVGAAKELRIYDMRLDLTWVAEDRVAVGQAAVTASSSLAWETVALQTPNGGAANWAKGNATTYTVVVRPPTGALCSPAQFTVRCLGQSGVTQLPQGSIPYRPVLGAGGVVLSEGDPGVLAMAVAFDVDASATDSADGQPYTGFRGDMILSGLQTVSGATAATYTYLSMLVMIEEGGSADLDWWIRTTAPATIDSGTVPWADVVASGFVGTFAPADPIGDVPVDVYGPVVIECSATLAAATTYQLQTGLTTTDLTVPQIAILSTRDSATTTVGNPATYGGTTLTYDGSPDQDGTATLSTQPDPVTGFTATPTPRTTAQPSSTPGDCGYQTVEEVQLNWNATALGADFAYYQIDRSPDDGATWHTIYKITDEDVDQATDQEHPYNRPTRYRIRVVRAGDLIPSDWSAEQTATATLDGCPLVLSTNLYPTRILAYPRGDTITWAYPSADETAIVAPTGIGYQAALISDEWRGDVFAPTLNIWNPGVGNPTTPPDPGRAMLDPIITLTRSAAPYTCARDETGRVWYANVTVSEGTRAEPFHYYTADTTITELTDTPAVLDLEASLLATASAWWDWRDGATSRSALVLDRTGHGNHLTPTAGTYGLPLVFGPEVEGDPLILSPGFTDEGLSTPDPGVAGDFLDITWEDETNGLTITTNRTAAYQGDDTGDNAGWYVKTTPANVPQLVFSPDGTAGAVVTVSATASTGPGRWRKRVVYESDGAGGSVISFYKQDPELPSSYIDLPVTDETWDPGGAPTNPAFPPTAPQPHSPPPASPADTIGGNGVEYNGLLYRLIIRDDNGQPIADLDPTVAVRPYATITGRAGEVWTFFRAATTNSTRADVIARACAVNGNTSYWSGGNIFDVGASDDITAAASLWQQSSAATINGVIGKAMFDLNPADEASWGIADIASLSGFNTILADGGGAPGTGYVIAAMAPPVEQGEVAAVGMTVDRTSDELVAYSSGVPSTAGDISGIGSASNAQPFVVGAFSHYGQGSYLCAAVFTRTLTESQMATLADEMQAAEPPAPNTPTLYTET